MINSSGLFHLSLSDAVAQIVTVCAVSIFLWTVAKLLVE